jgi:hypothetical protein
MDLDINPLNLDKTKYREANNVRILNDVGSTSFSISNVKGTLDDIIIPNTPEFKRLEVIAAGTTASLTIVTIAPSGITTTQTGPTFDTTGMNPQELYNYIIGAYSQWLIAYNIYIGNTFLVFVPNPGYTLSSITASSELAVTDNYVPAQSGLEIIGSVELRQKVYLFTTNNKTKNPGGHNPLLTIDSSSVGQIWQYTYDKITLNGTLKLIYNNYVDFSTYYAIPPTATEGRYENSGVERIYFTDNYNKLRSINCADPNSLALDISLLNIVPSVDMDRPILTNIGNGGGSSIKVGAYQACYRLKNTGGAVTNFCELSDIVYVVPSNEQANTGGANFRDYIGANAGSTTNKQITWTVSNLDKDYDRIEFAVAFRSTSIELATITIIDDAPISAIDSYKITYDGSQTEIDLTLEEFLSSSVAFTHCKTIGTKDNRLFVGNVKNLLSEIDYDARAFRALTSPPPSTLSADIYLTNDNVNLPYTSLFAEALPQTEDTINEYGTAFECKFKPNTNGGILGGKGLNISYEFYTEAIAADRASLGSFTDYIPDGTPAPWRLTNPDYNITSLRLDVKSFTDNYNQEFQEIPTVFGGNNINAGFKYPPYTSALRGFQRNEIYRFGIQFFDKSKNPTFVKWIGDIKMPDFWDYNNNSTYSNGVATLVNDFRLSFVSRNSTPYDEAFVQTLGIKFEVNIPNEISKLIDGYSIVRVKREDKDKTITSSGYLVPVDQANGGDLYMISPYDNNSMAYNENTTSITSPTNFAWYTTPDVIFPQIAPDTSQTMTISGILKKSGSGAVNVSAGAEPYYYFKLYDFSQPTIGLPTHVLGQCSYVGYGGDTIGPSSVGVYNYDKGVGDGHNPQPFSTAIGNPSYFIASGTSLPFNLAAFSTNDKLYVTFSRTLTNQYAGNTYSARANSTYISCSHYRPVRTSSATLYDNFKLFGGDIFVSMYDSCRAAKNFGAYTNRAVQPGLSRSTTFFFPVETTYNPDLRHGYYMNKDFPGNAEIEMKEIYTYNSSYHSECDVKSFFPKPDPFILNEEFDNRFHASEIKTNGEFTDSWGVFKIDNFWDVEGTYGPINAMQILKDKMFFWQSRAFGIIQINPRSVITDVNNDTNSALQVGTGLPLQRHDYISTEIGLQHQWGLTKSSYKNVWLDVSNKKFFASSGEDGVVPLSDVKGMFSYFNKNLIYNINNFDKPVYEDEELGINGVVAVYDFKYDQAIFTVHDTNNPTQSGQIKNKYTFVYDDRIGAFTSFMSFTPKIYFTDGYKIFSTDPDDLSRIYIHDSGKYCNFYFKTYDSSINVVSNESPLTTKVFDNLVYDSQAIDANGVNYNDDTWNTIRIYNDYQNTDYQLLIPGANIKRKERSWQLAVPRNRVLYSTSNSPNIFTDLSPTDKPLGERMRDKYVLIQLIYNNLKNRSFSFNNLKSIFRQSPR